MNYDKVVERFVGAGKVQPFELSKTSEGLYSFKFMEKGKHVVVEDTDGDFINKLFVEFGGENPETCRCNDKFIDFDGTWDSQDLLHLEHNITAIKLRGQRSTRDNRLPVPVPEECGSFHVINKGKGSDNRNVYINQRDLEKSEFTMLFRDNEEFDELVKFVLQHEMLGKLNWKVMKMNTYSIEADMHCVWRNVKAGDGTARRILELQEINSKHYTKLPRATVFDAAGLMHFGQCKKVDFKEKKSFSKKICMFAAEDGKVDISNLEVVSQ